MEQNYINKLLISFSCWLRAQSPSWQHTHRKHLSVNFQHDSFFKGIPSLLLFYIVLFFNATSYAQNNPNFYLASNGVTCITISTTAATNIAAVTATLGGSISNDCASNISERGIVCNTNPNPTVSNSRVKMGAGSGLFSGTVDNLYPNKTIYYKAYALVDNVPTYGDEQSFKTIRSPLSDFSWSLSDATVGAENVTYNFSYTTTLALGMNTEILYAVQQYNTTGWNTSSVLKENVTVSIDGVERAISSIWVAGNLIS